MEPSGGGWYLLAAARSTQWRQRRTNPILRLGCRDDSYCSRPRRGSESAPHLIAPRLLLPLSMAAPSRRSAPPVVLCDSNARLKVSRRTLLYAIRPARSRVLRFCIDGVASEHLMC